MVKVGDWVRIVEVPTEWFLAKGRVGEVVEISLGETWPYCVEVDGQDVWAFEVAPATQQAEAAGPASEPESPRAYVLDTAKALVLGDRNNTYGPPTQDFQRTAGVLSSLGYRKGDGQPLEAHDISVILAAVKLSRLMWSPDKADSWIDLAGYAACGHECVVDNGKDSV